MTIRAQTGPGTQVDIELVDGTSIHLDRDEDGTVVLAIDLGPGGDGVMARLSPPIAAYLAGRLAGAAGVKLS